MNSITTSPETLVLLNSNLNDHVPSMLDRRSSGLEKSMDIIESSKDYDGIRFSKKYWDILSLLFLITYGKKYFKGFDVYILVEIEDYLRKNRLFPEVLAALRLTDNRGAFLVCVLTYTKLKSSNQIYNTILNKDTVDRVLSKLSLKLVRHHNPKRLIRHKGYRDHGTLRLSHEWSESSDYSFTELQNLKEEQLEEYNQTVLDFIRDSGDWYLTLLMYLKN